MPQFGGAPKCPVCDKSVYFAEEFKALGKSWHIVCFKCSDCNKKLDSTSANDHDGKLYCKGCYGKNFGPSGYGYSGGASGLRTDAGQSVQLSTGSGNAHGLAGGKRCPRCDNPVYFAEELKALGRSWHKSCFVCTHCKSSLDSTKVTEHDDKIYCRSCYGRQFGPKGYGFSGGASGLSTDTGDIRNPHRSDKIHTQEAAVAPIKSSNGSRFGGGDVCGKCSKPVYMTEKAIGGGRVWHKQCFKCTTCGKGLDSTNVTDKDGEVYCKGCYGRNFGPKGVGFGIGAGTLSTN